MITEAPKILGDFDTSFLPDSPFVRNALETSYRKHYGQKRKSGEDYFTHCSEVSRIVVVEWGIENAEIIAASLMHDVAEDSDMDIPVIASLLGDQVASIVDGVTQLKSEDKRKGDEETLRKVISRSYLDPRVALIKLADRLHNMRTLGSMAPEKQVAKAQETLDVYTKLAQALGMWTVKTELEDLSFSYIDSEMFAKIKTQVDNDPRTQAPFLDHATTFIQRVLSENNIEADITTKRAGYWELFSKQNRLSLEGKSVPGKLENIDDLVSIRVAMKNEESCYHLLGKLHEVYGANVDFDAHDFYIGANKRYNGYQAIHLVTNSRAGKFEIALVTHDQEDFNKGGVSSMLKNEKHEWLEKYSLKLVFTPKGEIVFFPKKATGVDFAYNINPSIGAQAEKIIIDGKEFSITADIPNAATVEVVLADEARRAPSTELLNYCLPETSRIIQRQLLEQDRDVMTDEGNKKLGYALQKYGVLELEDLENYVNGLLFYMGCQTESDLYYKVANDQRNIGEVTSWLDSKGVSKESLGITSIKVTGKDKAGILGRLATVINKKGGNIIRDRSKTKDGRFTLTLVVVGIIPLENNLREILENDTNFDETIVV